MLAIAVSLLTAIYLLGPAFVKRYILKFFRVIPPIIQKNKSDEIGEAIFTALIPLSLALLWTAWHHAVSWGDLKPDLKIVFSGLYSEKIFEQSPPAFFKATQDVWAANWSVVWRLYLLLVVYSTVVGFIISYYREIRNLRFIKKAPWIKWALAGFVLPRFSKLYVLLTGFPIRSAQVTADILTTSGVLYRGTITEPYFAPDGSLSILKISDPAHFDRQRYMEEQKSGEGPVEDKYWRKIQGKSFLMMASEISTINLHWYDLAEIADQIEQIVKAKLAADWTRSS